MGDCGHGLFECKKSKRCLAEDDVCDDFVDCSEDDTDRSDEFDCGKLIFTDFLGGYSG